MRTIRSSSQLEADNRPLYMRKEFLFPANKHFNNLHELRAHFYVHGLRKAFHEIRPLSAFHESCIPTNNTKSHQLLNSLTSLAVIQLGLNQCPKNLGHLDRARRIDDEHLPGAREC